MRIIDKKLAFSTKNEEFNIVRQKPEADSMQCNFVKKIV